MSIPDDFAAHLYRYVGCSAKVYTKNGLVIRGILRGMDHYHDLLLVRARVMTRSGAPASHSQYGNSGTVIIRAADVAFYTIFTTRGPYSSRKPYVFSSGPRQ